MFDSHFYVCLPLNDDPLAEAIDRLTWAQRWREICERIARNVDFVGDMNEDQIDAEVREVRRETPLSERSSIPRIIARTEGNDVARIDPDDTTGTDDRKRRNYAAGSLRFLALGNSLA